MRIFTRELYNQLQENEDALYNTHFIRKGNGRGVRRIDEPSDELKRAQKFALRVLNNHARLLVHWRACGCIPGLDIRERAMQHAGWEWAITTDIRDFYPTVTFDMLANVRRLGTYMDHEDIRCCLRTINGEQVLPQGAPTSPMLSNIAVIDLDNAIENMLQRWLGDMNAEFGGIGYMEWQVPNRPTAFRGDAPHFRALYSRYMDDIIISLDCPERSDAETVKNALMGLVRHYGFVPNTRKTKLKPYYQKQKWIGFSLNGRDIVRNQPHVDKRYVNKVIEEGIEIVMRRGNPFEDLSWGGKLEYIRYNNTGRFHRVLRKVALSMHVMGVNISGWVQNNDEVRRALAAHERRVQGGEEEDHEVRPYWNGSHFYVFGSGSSDTGTYSYNDTNNVS
ncbi:MAG: reverse transcriptase domain-containing protein [Candidatus Thorarchaeota archaeon]|jgi:hypothetical protein